MRTRPMYLGGASSDADGHELMMREAHLVIFRHLK
jgi:hypothetical protein